MLSYHQQNSHEVNVVGLTQTVKNLYYYIILDSEDFASDDFLYYNNVYNHHDQIKS